MIEDYIVDLCNLLEVDVPKISYDTSKFQSKTTMAQCDLHGHTIYLAKINKPNPDYIFAIAHEIRHIWQLHYHKNTYFVNYKPIHMADSLSKYNLQPAEIDANAFAAAIMINWFGLRPQWDNVPQNVINEINKRMKLISV